MSGARTTKLSLYKPALGEQGWGDKVNANFDTLDSTLADYKAAGFVKLGHLEAGVQNTLAGAMQTGTPAGGDLSGALPNPVLKDIGTPAGTYPRATVTVDAKGRVTGIAAGDADGGTPGAGKVGTAQLADGAVTEGKIGVGAVTDGRIGSRAVVAADPSAGQTGTLTQWLSWFLRRVTQLTGRPWGEAPSTSIEELHANALRRGRAETVAGTWAFSQPLSVPEPSAEGHAATAGFVNRAVASVDTSVPLGGVGPQHLTESARAYDVASFYPGRPLPQALLLYWVAPRDTVLRVGNVGRGAARIAAAANTSLTIYHSDLNGARAVGGVAFNAQVRTAQLWLTQDVTLRAGEELLISAPATQDVTLADVSLTLSGTYLPDAQTVAAS